MSRGAVSAPETAGDAADTVAADREDDGREDPAGEHGDRGGHRDVLELGEPRDERGDSAEPAGDGGVRVLLHARSPLLGPSLFIPCFARNSTAVVFARRVSSSFFSRSTTSEWLSAQIVSRRRMSVRLSAC
jgi:hypothetical protein